MKSPLIDLKDDTFSYLSSAKVFFFSLHDTLYQMSDNARPK